MKKIKRIISAAVVIMMIVVIPVTYAICKSDTCNHEYEWVEDGTAMRQIGTHTERKPWDVGPGYREYPCVMFRNHIVRRCKCKHCGSVIRSEFIQDIYSPIIHTPAY